MNGFKKGSQNDETKTMFEIYICGVYGILRIQPVCVIKMCIFFGFIRIYASFIHGLPFQEVSYLNPTPSFDTDGLIKTLQL